MLTWISGNEFARRFQIDPHRAETVAELNGIRRRVIRGTPTRYCLEDVERVLAQSVVGGPQPATRPPRAQAAAK